MMTSVQVSKKASPNPSFKPLQQSRFKPRPFISSAEGQGAPSDEPLFGYSLSDVSAFTNEGVQPEIGLVSVAENYERQQGANRVARQVMGAIPSSDQESVRRKEDEDESDEDLEELEEEEEEELLEGGSISRPVGETGKGASSPSAEGAGVKPDLEREIQQARGKGVPLADNIRAPMEQAFGADFGKVKVHSDRRSDALNRPLHARAFTVGQDIFFRQGEYDPRDSRGQELVAHELTHVMQQGGDRVKHDPIPNSAMNTVVPKLPSNVNVPGEDSKNGDGPKAENVAAPEAENVAVPEAESVAAPVAQNIAVTGAKKGENLQGNKVAEVGAGIEETAVEGEAIGGEGPLEQPAREGSGAGPQPHLALASRHALPKQSGEVSNIANRFFSASATDMARGMGELGQKITLGFAADRNKLAQNTPKITGRIDAKTVPAPEERAAPEIAPLPLEGEWKVPSTGVKRPDAPKFKAEGDADPQLAETYQQESSAEVQAQQTELNQGIADNPGESQIQPVDVTEVREMSLASSQTKVATKVEPEMAEYLDLPYPGSVRKAADAEIAPQIEQRLSGTRSTVSEAIEKRDRDHAQAVEEVQNESAELTENAQKEQLDTVLGARASVKAEKERGIAECQGIMAEFHGNVSQEKEAKLQQINERIAQDEKRAEGELNRADAEVRKEEKKAEQEEEKEKKKAEKKKKKKSFWGSIASFFNKIAKAFKSAVKTIYKNLKKAVKGILKAAKNLANSIIDKCRNFVTDALKTLGSVMKGLVNVALAAFPGVRDRLNSAIDGIVEKTTAAVNSIADTLKDTINSLVDKLDYIVDFACNFCETMVEGAIAMLGALLTGDFLAMYKIAFMTACNSVGLPGEELYNILERAGPLTLEVIKHPGNFLKNLSRAGKKGFNQFMANFDKHLEKGLLGWLLGQLEQKGIKIPSTFTSASVFELVRQSLGITREYVRARAVTLIGEENVERVETVARYIEMLFTEGPQAVYNELKGKGEDAKKTLVDDVQNWAITQVVQKAVIKISSMLIPGGAFVQAIIGIYNTIQFFLENAKQIAALVNTILDSIRDIAKGAIGTAANYIEQSMQDSLPLVFSFMAKQVGVSNVGGKIEEIIEKLRTPVNKAVDATIQGIIKLGKAAWGKIKSTAKKGKEALKEWWKRRTAFTTKTGARHELYFKGTGKQAVAMVASDEAMPVADRLSKWKSIRADPASSPEMSKASGLIRTAEGLLNRSPPDGDKLADISKQLFDIFEPSSGGAKGEAETYFEKEVEKRGGATADEIDQILSDAFKQKYGLTEAKFEGADREEPKVVFYPKPVVEVPLIQAKLAVNPPGDAYEQEADRMAQKVMSAITSSDQGQVQRVEEDEELRRKVSGGTYVRPDLESAIRGARSKGMPLSDGVRQPMERAFGADFGRVRLHTDGEADSLNRSIQARAFTTGQDVFFRQGEFRPGSSEGQRLLAHELTHVVPQNGSAVQREQPNATGRVIQRVKQPRRSPRIASNQQQTARSVRRYRTARNTVIVRFVPGAQIRTRLVRSHALGRRVLECPQGSYIHRVNDFNYTGSRQSDFDALNRMFNYTTGTPHRHVWHHYHNFRSTGQNAGIGTMFLLPIHLHRSGHVGGVYQWNNTLGNAKYR